MELRVPHVPTAAPHPQTHLAPSRRVPYPENAKLAIRRPKAASEIQAIPMILPRFRRNSQARTIAALYGAIVAQARSVAFYADYGVPDTVEGRFDLIVLHLVLLLHRLDRQRGGRRAGQSLGSGAFRRVLPRSRCQFAGNGHRRPRRAEANAGFRRGVLRPASGLSGRPDARGRGSLRRRWNAISFRRAAMPARPSWRAMRARR